MIICVDIGNSNMVLGFYQNDQLLNTIRMKTDSTMTSDEIGVKFLEFLKVDNIDKKEVEGVIISSVVPSIDRHMTEMVNKYFKLNPLFVNPGIKTSVNIRINNPKECGADLLVGAVGAITKYGPDVIVIDMGTAITITYVNEKQEFLGGAIMPGINTSYRSLFSKTSKLESVGIEEVTSPIGKDTKSCIQSGMLYGTVSMLEGMISRYKELYPKAKVVITGGESSIIIPYFNKSYKLIYDENLLLDGLNILYKKNKGEKR